MNRPAGFPDFFIIGAPRCGTTALSRYLSRHPHICFSRPKETHYFAQLSELPSENDLKRDYIDRYFGHRTNENRLSGEGSVSYLHLPGPIEQVMHFNPDAKFIAMVRNPLTVLPSYHQKMLFLLQEDEPDFSRAWALQSARARGEYIPKTCLDPLLLNYGEGVKLGAQIERLFNTVGRDRAHVIVFDDFAADTLSVYRELLDFLELDDDGQTEFERRFESQMYRYHWLQRLLFIPVTKGGKAMDSLQRRKRKYRKDGTRKPGLIKWITQLNKVAVRPAPLTPQLATIIRELLHDDVQLLGQLLQRDLGFWLATDAADKPSKSSA